MSRLEQELARGISERRERYLGGGQRLPSGLLAALEAGRAAGVWPLTEATAEGAAENHHLVEGKDGSFRYRVGP